MSGNVWLITGSRSLSPDHRACPGTAASEQWAKSCIAEAFEKAGFGLYSTVIHGGAIGPDSWAAEIAQERGCIVVRYDLDGWAYLHRNRTRRWRAKEGPCVNPLERNEAMIRAMVVSLELGASSYGSSSLVFAMNAPWAKTRGTQHTATLAREYWIDVKVETCPPYLGGKR